VSGADVGRVAVTEAEDGAFGGTELDRTCPLEDLVALADDVTSGSWWAAAAAPRVRVAGARAGTASSSARAAAARPGEVVVRVADGQRTVGTVTHELAHALAGVASGHDARFRAAHVDLVAVVAGADAGRMLASAYAAAGVPAGRRGWPAPFRAVGAGFVVVP